MKKLAFFAILAFLSLSSGSFRVIGITPDTLRPRFREISVPNPSPPVGKGLKRAHRFALPREPIAAPETIRVCAIRVQFQPDSNPKSTGNGQFMLEPNDSIKIDPPPHNKSYFAAHLEALKMYYQFVSHGKLVIEYDIYPDGENDAYTLPDSMGYYGPDGWFGENPGDRLYGFFRDAIKFVDSVGGVPFCNYDVIIIFHAGSDWQNDIASFFPELVEYDPNTYIPTPEDLPTAYITIPETIAGCVDRGIVMPEFCSQDGRTVALNGVLAHEFGHALGLVDLYSTYDFTTAVGYFSLMDNGHAVGIYLLDEETGETLVVYGALPVYPSAWERAYLGWESPVIIDTPTTNFPIRGCELPVYDTPTIAKIPIDEFEYFLIENRRDSFWSASDSVNIKRDSLTGVIMGIQVNGEYVGAYDFLLPGAGILIWHVDERVAYGDYDGNGVDNFLDNELQWDWRRRFIDLEEADGIQGFDLWYDYLGESKDFFRWPSATMFGPNTTPNTNNNDGGRTGIEIYDISRSDTVMTFSLRYDGPHLRWKGTVGYPLLYSPVIAELDGDGKKEIVAQSYGYLFVWRNDGKRFNDASDSIGLIIFDGDTVYFPFPVVYEFDTAITQPVVGDIDGDGRNEIILADSSKLIWALVPDSNTIRFNMLMGYPAYGDNPFAQAPLLHDIDSDGKDEIVIADVYGILYMLDETGIRWRFDMGGEPVGAVGIGEKVIAVAQQAKGRVYILSSTGELMGEFDLPFGKLNQPVVVVEDSDTIIVLTSKESGTLPDGKGKPLPYGQAKGFLFAVNIDGEILPNFPVELPSKPSAPIVTEDEDFGFRIIFTAETLVCCYQPNGAPCENFPVTFYDEEFWDSPALVDFDSDGRIDIVAASEYDRMICVNEFGEKSAYSPLGIGTAISSPAVGDIDDDGRAELVISSYEGIIYVWDNFGSLKDIPDYLLDARNNRVLFVRATGETETKEANIVYFYNHPNPFGEVTYFRFLIKGQSGRAEITVFDDAGNIVANLSGSYVNNIPCEILWQTPGIASGIYWAVLDAGGAGTRKIAVAVVK